MKPSPNATAHVFHHPTCSTCKKALAWLAAHHVAVTPVPIAESPPTADQLEAAILRSGLPAKRFFNLSGQSYRGGGWSTKVDALSVREAAEALAADGMLIKRPLLLRPDLVLVGFSEPAWATALGK